MLTGLLRGSTRRVLAMEAARRLVIAYSGALTGFRTTPHFCASRRAMYNPWAGRAAHHLFSKDLVL